MTRITSLRLPVTLAAVSTLALGLLATPAASAAPAAPTAPAVKPVKVQKLAVSSRQDGDARLVVKVKGKGVKKVRVITQDAKFRLRKAKPARKWRTDFQVQVSTWQSPWVEGTTADGLRASVGEGLEVAVTAGRQTVVQEVSLKPGPGTPANGGDKPAPDNGGGDKPAPDNGGGTPDNGGGGSTPAPLFTAPSSDLVGPDALAAIQPYFLDSRFTDCPAGWGSGTCAVEQRYSHMTDLRQYYCRLTSVSGADINSIGTIMGFVGAEFKTDGSWAVTYMMDSYGSPTHYTWRVAADGSVTGEYWGPGKDPTTTAGEAITGLQWARGGLPCDQLTP